MVNRMLGLYVKNSFFDCISCDFSRAAAINFVSVCSADKPALVRSAFVNFATSCSNALTSDVVVVGVVVDGAVVVLSFCVVCVLVCVLLVVVCVGFDGVVACAGFFHLPIVT